MKIYLATLDSAMTAAWLEGYQRHMWLATGRTPASQQFLREEVLI